uniref:PHD-type domain-containing protein n=1 Tax=Chenopodium quinoa TaxID=63459 RepID=A0A803MGH9_CHEQI
MKRELAALEMQSPVIGRTTRSSKRLSVGGSSPVSENLVYKRVKRSTIRARKSEVLSNGGGDNGAVEVSEASGGVGDQNGAHDPKPEEKIGVQEGDIGVAVGVDSEVVKLVCDEEVKNVDEVSSMENEVCDDVEVNGELFEEQNLVAIKIDYQDAVVNGVHANGGIIEVEEVLEGDWTKSPLNANGKAKKSSLERYPRRFTRSALKSKEDIVAKGNDYVDQSEGNSKGVMYEGNGEVCKDIVVFSEASRSESNGVVKNSLIEKYSRRVTRSASKPKVDDSDREKAVPATLDTEMAVVTVDIGTVVPVKSSENAECDAGKDSEEPSSAVPRRKLEMKMSKQISQGKVPSNVQELLATGLLEGCPVYYDGGKGLKLNGRIRGIGILCSCGLCKGCKVIPPSLFEIHACNKYKRAVQYIYLENGRSLIHILKACKSTRLSTLEATIQNAIGPLPEKKLIVCQNCKEPFSSMDAESSEPVCSKCVMLNLSSVGPVYSTRKRSSKFVFPSQSTSACDNAQDISPKNSIENSGEAILTPKLHTSQADLPSEMLQGRSRAKLVKKSAGASLTPKLRSSSRMGRISETNMCEKIVKNAQDSSMSPKTCVSPVVGKSAGTKDHKKLKRRSSKLALSPKPSPGNACAKVKTRLREEVLTPKPSKTPTALKSSEKKTSGKITRKDLRLHKLVFEDDVLPDGTVLGYYARGQKLLEGSKKGSGILCNCCDTVVSASQFEAHAGCASRRKPYCYIYTSNGVSLHELSVTLIKDRRHSAKYNDDLCSICADGGNLLLCDGCPRAFHTECASLPSIPRGKWYCKYCQNMFEREKFVAHNANALAAGRVSGVDSIEQITKQSIRIVNNLASEVSACILCSVRRNIHVGCLKDHNMADLTLEMMVSSWFRNCRMGNGFVAWIVEGLNLLCRIFWFEELKKLPKSLVDIIRKKNMHIGSDSGSDLEVSWRLLSGKIASPETRPLLSQAVAFFHESFAPIIDVVSGHDLMTCNGLREECGWPRIRRDVLCCVNRQCSEVVVSAGIFRIFGPDVAELPLVATSSGNHGKGYFQTLFACIERLLAFLKVKTIVLPAAEEAGSIWTDRFGFTKMTLDQIRELKRNFWSLVRFQGTSMLHKLVPDCREFKSLADS